MKVKNISHSEIRLYMDEWSKNTYNKKPMCVYYSCFVSDLFDEAEVETFCFLVNHKDLLVDMTLSTNKDNTCVIFYYENYSKYDKCTYKQEAIYNEYSLEIDIKKVLNERFDKNNKLHIELITNFLFKFAEVSYITSDYM